MMITAELLSFLSTIIGILSVIWIAARSVERLKNQATSDLLKLESAVNLSLEKLKGADEKHEYIINAIKELIEHRTGRLGNELKDLRKDLNDTQRFLNKTTSFQIRSQEDVER
ncbi:hypothetical protein IQ268_11090 [Oculatella sp. LEGE 06141]|uniref:hypothetical protein n=1 Tax=Oculatella sp. LEGE 06141 TaxID=1828648 RepID=UPI0018821573|nr:hypothetical protein [Oculatella sp. LEGE 06141]MBE9179106.1 hypothetical protein [Oculatella sp. LEGE 06141]